LPLVKKEWMKAARKKDGRKETERTEEGAVKEKEGGN